MMYDQIEADVILANALLKLERVGASDLRFIRGAMSVRFPDVHVDVTDDGVTGAVSDHGDLFEFESTDSMAVFGLPALTRRVVAIRFNPYITDAQLRVLQGAIRKLAKSKETEKR